MTHRRKVARRKPWKRRQRLYKLYGKEFIDWMDGEMLAAYDREIDKAILYGAGATSFGPRGILSEDNHGTG